MLTEAFRRGRSQTPVAICLVPHPEPQPPTSAQQNQTDATKKNHPLWLIPGLISRPPRECSRQWPNATGQSPRKNPKDHHSRPITSKEECSKHLYLPAGMLQHDAATVRPSFPAQLAGIPLIFLVGKHPGQETRKNSVKATGCGPKTNCSFSGAWKMTDSSPSPPPRGPQLASGPGKLFLCNH